MLVACRWTKQYKAQRPPRCGCLTCQNKWLTSEVERLSRAVSSLTDWQRRHDGLDWGWF